MEFKKIKEAFLKKMKTVRVAFTGLNHDEKEILSAMTAFGIRTSNIEDCTLLVCGSECNGSAKVDIAKEMKIPIMPLEEFKKKYMFNHEFGSVLQGKNVGSSLCFPDSEVVYLMNPKSVVYVNSMTKKRALVLDYFFSETPHLDDIHDKLSKWLRLENDKAKIILDERDLKAA